MIALFKKQKKRESKEKEGTFFRILLPLTIFILIVFLLISNFRIYQKRTKLGEQIENLKKETQALEEKAGELKSRISRTGKESYWEEKIRQKGYVKEGEKQVVVLPPKAAGEENTALSQGASLLEKIKNFFAGMVQR